MPTGDAPWWATVAVGMMAVVPGTISARRSKRDAQEAAARAAAAEARAERSDAVEGFDKLTGRLAADNESLRRRVDQLEEDLASCNAKHTAAERTLAETMSQIFQLQQRLAVLERDA